jgi:predicted ATPase
LINPRGANMPRYILTGTPGAGKTAILRLLELNGYAIVEEAATDIIALDHALGNNELSDASAFIDKILTLQRRRQASMQPADLTIFFDRSPVCTLALSHYLSVTPSRLLIDNVARIVTEGTYEPTVFFVRNQGFIHATSARRISFESSLTFERLHEQIYGDLGFHLVEVPAGPLPERVTLIQQTIERLQGDPRDGSPIDEGSAFNAQARRRPASASHGGAKAIVVEWRRKDYSEVGDSGHGEHQQHDGNDQPPCLQ